MLVRREGLPPIRLHDLRHGAATFALASGAGLKAIQAMLGHASIILTADTYTSVLPESPRRVRRLDLLGECPAWDELRRTTRVS